MSQKSRDTFDTTKNLSEIVRIITKTDNSLVDFFQQERDTKLLSVALDISHKNIDLRTFCGKTGKPLDVVSLDDYAELVEIHGEKRAEHILNVTKIGKVDPRWLYTDSKALTELLKNDPYGYFVYACSSILIPVQDSKIRDVLITKEQRKQFQLEWMHEKRKCWENIQNISLEEIFEANQIMTKFLSIFRTTKVYAGITFIHEEISPATIGIKKTIQEWIADIRNSITNILTKEIEKGAIRRHLTLNDISNLHEKFEGYSNFRGMRGRTRISENEQIIHALADFIPDDVVQKVRTVDSLYNTNKLHLIRGMSKKSHNGVVAKNIDTTKKFKIMWKGKQPKTTEGDTK